MLLSHSHCEDTTLLMLSRDQEKISLTHWLGQIEKMRQEPSKAVGEPVHEFLDLSISRVIFFEKTLQKAFPGFLSQN